MTKEIEGPVSLFELGRIVVMDGAIKATTHEFRTLCLSRHVRGDWGSLCKDDWAENLDALTQGNKLLSAYPIDEAAPTECYGYFNRLWIITEADRRLTTLLLPREY